MGHGESDHTCQAKHPDWLLAITYTEYATGRSGHAAQCPMSFCLLQPPFALVAVETPLPFARVWITDDRYICLLPVLILTQASTSTTYISFIWYCNFHQGNRLQVTSIQTSCNRARPAAQLCLGSCAHLEVVLHPSPKWLIPTLPFIFYSSPHSILF